MDQTPLPRWQDFEGLVPWVCRRSAAWRSLSSHDQDEVRQELNIVLIDLVDRQAARGRPLTSHLCVIRLGDRLKDLLSSLWRRLDRVGVAFEVAEIPAAEPPETPETPEIPLHVLTRAERRVVTLFYGLGGEEALDMATIAITGGMTLSAARRALSRARGKLAVALAEAGHGAEGQQ